MEEHKMGLVCSTFELMRSLLHRKSLRKCSPFFAFNKNPPKHSLHCVHIIAMINSGGVKPKTDWLLWMPGRTTCTASTSRLGCSQDSPMRWVCLPTPHPLLHLCLMQRLSNISEEKRPGFVPLRLDTQFTFGYNVLRTLPANAQDVQQHTRLWYACSICIELNCVFYKNSPIEGIVLCIYFVINVVAQAYIL
eukprot:scaffold77870_cov19-Tisochrysis_lutea.AAC.1